jgi:hypothetical protein
MVLARVHGVGSELGGVIVQILGDGIRMDVSEGIVTEGDSVLP